eukprot:TRINITY_DN13825_c0_g1_i1.p3 TRINITY_DN13825_c0_g1~~TRINITY_DN13825_c0_g1_i1.p3  ORF type:complete len:114 (-),score=32.77 TRINITY_DN13825_c0_g1_i1:30-371(-)
MQEVKQYGDENALLLLLGNKADLTFQKAVDSQQAQQYSDSQQIIFLEASAKTAQNTSEAFIVLAKKLIEKKQIQEEELYQKQQYLPPKKCCPCLLYTSPSPRDRQKSRMPSSA